MGGSIPAQRDAHAVSILDVRCPEAQLTSVLSFLGDSIEPTSPGGQQGQGTVLAHTRTLPFDVCARSDYRAPGEYRR